MADGNALWRNPSDFDMLGNMFNTATQDQGAQEAAVANAQIQKLAQTSSWMSAEQQAQNIPVGPEKQVIRRDANGNLLTDFTGLTQDQVSYFQKASQFYQQALGGYAQEAKRLEMERQRVESQPWMQLATALSANLAQAKDMPGWVQGLGRTAAQLNPTVDELRARKLAVLGKGAEMSEKGMALGIAQERTIEDRAQRQEARVMQAEAQRQKLVKEAYDNLAQAVDKGPGMMNGKTAAAILTKAGARADELGPLLDQLGNLAANVGKAFEIKRDDVVKAQDLASKQEDRRTRALGEMVRLGEARLTQGEERIKQAEFLSQKSDYNKNTAMSTAEQAAVQSGFNVLNLTKKLEDVAGKKTVSPITGRVQYVNPYRPAEWQAIQLYSNQMLLSGLAGKLGAGVSDRDVALMKQMVPSGTMTQEQFEATNRVLKSVNEDNIRSLMRANPNIQQWKTMEPQFKKLGLEKMYAQAMDEMKTELGTAYPAVFGPDRPAIAERTFGADTTKKPTHVSWKDYVPGGTP